MKEIGGYFQYESSVEGSYYNAALAFNTARNCLKYIIRKNKIRKIKLPYYICRAVIDACRSEQCEIEYYHISNTFKPIIKGNLKKAEWLYIVNYYGQLDIEDIKGIVLEDDRIIWDNAQAFFAKPMEGIKTIYTCRKFFPVPDGAYLAGVKDPDFDKLVRDLSYNRFEHIWGRFELDAQTFFSKYQENEKILDNLPIRRMSKVSSAVLSEVKYSEIKSIRERNFLKLQEKLSSINKLRLKKCEGPFTYPLLINTGEHLKKRLISQKIYVPTFWPNLLEEEKLNKFEKGLVEKLVCIPCDQRYKEEDMEYISNIIYSHLGN